MVAQEIKGLKLLKHLFILMLFIVVFIGASVGAMGPYPIAHAAADLEELDKLLPLVGGALASASQKDWEGTSTHITEASELWKSLNIDASSTSADVDSAFAHADQALAAAEDKPDEVKAALSTLAKAINSYVKAEQQAESSAGSGKDAAVALLPTIDQLLTHIQAGQWDEASTLYKQINNGWPAIEQAIRTDNFNVYGKLETSMSLIRIALQAEPPREEQAEAQTKALIQLINDYKDDKVSTKTQDADNMTISALILILDKASKDIASGHYSEAEGQMQSFISSWPSVEGQVQLRSADAYSKIEIQMTDVAKYLLSSPPSPEQAEAVITSIRTILEPMTGEAKYTAVDAGLILFREGLEAILVLAALLAYLKRTGNQSKSVWVWSGVWTGLLLSIGVAVLLTTVIAQATAGSAREAMEGITGLVSVLLMLTVGNWLHNKSNVQSWNQYIDGKMGSALARGSLWSLFIVSGLAILREGAETAIFYVGMASSIEPLQMIIGIAVTFVLLVALGFAIIRFSAKLPIRPFFLTASALIYYLVIRFLGESIHSLQVAAWLPAHSSSGLPTISALGAYPTWETTIPQLIVLAIIVGRIAWIQLLAWPATKRAA